ncbi:acetyl-CoA synthetase-like protein [Hymenopellis radicata]|nr:acetyl-CoA synthetase-like protein [Hymenopellis radicata]
MHRMVASLESKRDAILLRPLVSRSPLQWSTVSYRQFLDQVRISAAHWYQKLQIVGVQSHDTIGLWLTGHVYTDLVHLYGISLAGFVPQVFSVSFSSVAVVKDLLEACAGKALLYDSAFAEAIAKVPIPSFSVPLLDDMTISVSTLPPIPAVDEHDTAMIFHTSGTTSGKPKPVRESHAFFHAQAKVQWTGAWIGTFDTQDVFNNLGSFAHVGTATSMSYLSYAGHCLVETSRSDFTAEELKLLVNHCGVNRLFLYAPWLSSLVSVARTDPEVLTILRGIRQISYTGAALNPDDEAWAVENGLPLTVMYATTEVGPCMISDMASAGTLPSMRLIPNTGVEFIPAREVKYSDVVLKRNEAGALYDFFVHESSPSCPHSAIRNRPNGHITGDLFEEVRPGWYIFRGRNDDWIRIGVWFCDTKSIEDNILKSCADIVSNCTVVGHYKPAPVLFVEPAVDDDADRDALKREIIERTAGFNERLFAHERITTPDCIVVVPRGNLSRTSEKGNIRRKAVEDEHGEILAKIYASF